MLITSPVPGLADDAGDVLGKPLPAGSLALTNAAALRSSSQFIAFLWRTAAPGERGLPVGAQEAVVDDDLPGARVLSVSDSTCR